jgi:alanyl-tRNA synthetase
VVLGSDYEGGKIILGRSKDLDLDCAALAKEAGKLLGGGGGGKPEFAQAGGSSDNLEKVMVEIKKILKKLL